MSYLRPTVEATGGRTQLNPYEDIRRVLTRRKLCREESLQLVSNDERWAADLQQAGYKPE